LGGGQGRIFFHFLFVPDMFPLSSQWVIDMFPKFPMCSPKVFAITPHFNPICFAQSPPLLTYIGGPKGKALHLSIESSILGSLHSFFAMGQSNWFIATKKKVGFVKHPPLINMKQVIKYPQFIGCYLWGVLAQAKNGGELFCEISCNQWEGPSMHSRCLAFFLFKFCEGRIFFHFSMVPTMFPLSSHEVRNMFLNVFSIAPHFYPICFGKCCPPFTYIGGPKGTNCILQNITFYFVEPP
jgi:hypothetical protein